VKLVNTCDSKSHAARFAGSSPAPGTVIKPSVNTGLFFFGKEGFILWCYNPDSELFRRPFYGLLAVF
jgi:hypothetical protein